MYTAVWSGRVKQATPDVKAGLEKGRKLRIPDEVRDLSKEEIFAKDAPFERLRRFAQRVASSSLTGTLATVTVRDAWGSFDHYGYRLSSRRL